MLLYKNEYIEITREAGTFFVRSTMRGMSLEAFNKVLRDAFPNVRITSFIAIKNVLLKAPYGPEPFGEERERVTISVTDDALKAYMTLYVADEDLAAHKRVELVKEIFESLSKAGIVYGIKTNVLASELKSGVEYLIAEGIPAVNGTDAVIKTYEITAPKPQVIDSGKVNHYELNLINHVEKGEWLGERIEPTPGIPGKNVMGKEIPPIPGKTYPLLYDRVSVYEETANGVTTLYAKKSGAVYYKGDAIGVYDYLEIKGDVDFSTGNVDFDGFLSIKGTVEDNFCVAANRDIEILGEYGVGAAEQIISREGNVYIKGGIAGKGKATLKCKKNLYVKYLSDITVECEGNVYIGFYSMNSYIKARQVIIESPRGRIIGGVVEAEVRISAAQIGNQAESRTIVRVRGFDRNRLKGELDTVTARLEDCKNQLARVKQHMQVYSCSSLLTDEQRSVFENMKNQYADLRDELKSLEYTLKGLIDDLKTPGEGAIISKDRCYPKVRVEIKGLSLELSKEYPMTTFYYHDNDLKTM